MGTNQAESAKYTFSEDREWEERGVTPPYSRGLGVHNSSGPSAKHEVRTAT